MEIFLIFMILAITLSSLRINVIYLNRSVFLNLLFAGVLVALLALTGSCEGGYGSFFQVTTEPNELCEGLHVFSYHINGVTTIAEYVFYSIISNNSIVSCEGLEELPIAMQFENLHLVETLKMALDTIKGQSGVYCFKHLETNTMYIGSAMDLYDRFYAHLMCYSSNLHLQRAITLYGLPAFTFIVVELCDTQKLLIREQHWLNWLFAQPSNLRYNFLPTAGSSLGYKHSDEAKAKISAALSGENHPNFGKPSVRRVGVSLFDLEGNLIQSFPSQTAAAIWLAVSKSTVLRYIRSGKVFRGKYLITNSLLESRPPPLYRAYGRLLNW